MDNRRQSQTRDHVSVDVKEDALVSSIKDKMETAITSISISRVPDDLRKGNENMYIPDKVSIGPLHHGNTLKSMDDNKWRYMYALLNRKPNLEASLDRCVELLRGLEHRARLSYKDGVNLPTDDFVQMMLVDGCFIIELFLKYTLKNLRHRNDPIFSTHGMLSDLRCNLMLLENQIPYFILQRLFQIVPIPRNCGLSLNELAFRFFKRMIPGDLQLKVLQERFNYEGYHLLDLIHHCFLPTYPRVQPKEGGTQQQGLDCATKLKKARIRFKKAHGKSLLDIKFVNGVLELPSLKFNKDTEILFRNLIALEQSHCDSTQHSFTSYAFLMASLVCSEKDLKLLGKQQILIYEKDKRKEASELFRKLCVAAKPMDSYYRGLFEHVNEYRRTHWLGFWQRLKHSRAKSPVSLVVFVLAIMLIVLTFVGAFFSVLTFCLHHI
ncbi:UPF0481 protein At3g47200-like [Juglans microcarpa x Juglans regia]|uniref:UPF0481 protein At3g47200-like n=1 Tax=Juglans microcarpa x Juglans regia TaxID=2249226 RepID=UPI001B7F03D0|nr:UPF0481 protein At3g47200-like [Juglans microcarpa x Juglans regia]XP_040999836.1 UPF0481 protein At3g47200-like [Juglans microcarpa x Juglans regia]XP_040999838.1 UPF0481 protein At3g47200-like [Juglans microcarpa x Juglans regia]